MQTSSDAWWTWTLEMWRCTPAEKNGYVGLSRQRGGGEEKGTIILCTTRSADLILVFRCGLRRLPLGGAHSPDGREGLLHHPASPAIP